MTNQEKMKKLQAEAPEEVKIFLEAARLLKKFDGFCISATVDNLNKITSILTFTPSTKEGRELKKGLLKTAEEKSREGMMGKGMFFID